MLFRRYLSTPQGNPYKLVLPLEWYIARVRTVDIYLLRHWALVFFLGHILHTMLFRRYLSTPQGNPHKLVLPLEWYIARVRTVGMMFLNRWVLFFCRARTTHTMLVH